MPEIRAFSAWRYNKNKIRTLASVVAPPYDVISPAEQRSFYRQNLHNVVRLILGRTKPGDTSFNNQYTRAGRFFNDWVSSGVLVKDKRPSIYVYAQDYHVDGKPQSRLGFIALMRLDEKAVLRHENTLAAPKKDRLALMKEVRANLSPIFGLFEDWKGKVQKILKKTPQPPAADVLIDGVRHRLFVETRPHALREIGRLMRHKPMFIADGHHRFEVACQFRDWMRSKIQARLVRHRARRTNPPQSAADWDYVMTYFSDCRHNPFAIFPTHRLIRVGARHASPLQLLNKKGVLEKVAGTHGRAPLQEVLSSLSREYPHKADKGYRFGVYTRKDGFFILTLDKRWAPSKNAGVVEKLDVSVLHRVILGPCFGIHKIEKSSAIDFTRDAQVACDRVRRGEFDLAVFLKATSLEDMIRVSKRGLKMPQKSTYFYPKLLSGLAFHRLAEAASLPQKEGMG